MNDKNKDKNQYKQRPNKKPSNDDDYDDKHKKIQSPRKDLSSSNEFDDDDINGKTSHQRENSQSRNNETNKTDSDEFDDPLDQNKPSLFYFDENENKQNISKEIDETTKTTSSSEEQFESDNTENDYGKVCQNNYSKEIKQILQAKKNIIITNEKFEKIIQGFEFIFISKINEIDKLTHELRKSDFVVNNHYEEPILGPDAQFFIACFEKTLIIFNQDFLSIIFNRLLQNNHKLLFLFIGDTKSFFEKFTDIEYEELEYDKKIFSESVHNMNYLVSIPKLFEYKVFYKNIISCISGYLFLKSYLKTKSNRINRFF